MCLNLRAGSTRDALWNLFFANPFTQIHVTSPWNEFFSPLLEHGVHWFEVQHAHLQDLYIAPPV